MSSELEYQFKFYESGSPRVCALQTKRKARARTFPKRKEAATLSLEEYRKKYFELNARVGLRLEEEESPVYMI